MELGNQECSASRLVRKQVTKNVEGRGARKQRHRGKSRDWNTQRPMKGEERGGKGGQKRGREERKSELELYEGNSILEE